jgi:hypothetical protein
MFMIRTILEDGRKLFMIMIVIMVLFTKRIRRRQVHNDYGHDYVKDQDHSEKTKENWTCPQIFLPLEQVR